MYRTSTLAFSSSVLLLACSGGAPGDGSVMQPGVIGDAQGSSGTGTSSGNAGTGQTTTGQSTGSQAMGGGSNPGSSGAANQQGMVVTAGNGAGGEAAGAGGDTGEAAAGGVGGTTLTAGAGGAAGTPTTVITAGAGAGDEPFCGGGATVEATAGTFMTHCDDNGDLVQYSCELVYQQDPNCVGPVPVTGPAAPLLDIAAPFCGQIARATGNVIESVSECGGLCADAACPNLCPEYDERLVYRSIDRDTGSAVFAFDRVGHDLSCELIFDRADDGYDCIADPEPEREIIVPSLGLGSPYCVQGNIGNIGVNDPTHADQQECSYRCDVLAR